MAQSRVLHPCQSCGACCGSYRVTFYWLAAEPGTLPQVPLKLTEDLDLNYRCMKGTNNKHHPRCVALDGRIGDHVHCSIYESRPSPCREFQASYENGYSNTRCDLARAKHGLRKLSKHDWIEWNQSLPECRPKDADL